MTLKKYDYRGCGKCPLSTSLLRGNCIKEYRVDLKIRIVKPISWERWGGLTPVFNVGDEVDAKGVAKNEVLYCVGAESTIHPGVKDYIMLDAIDILEEKVNGN